MLDKINETTNFIQEKIKDAKPTVAVILGSGLGEFADQVTNKIEIPYSEIPHFTKTTVKGHAGRCVTGEINNVQVLLFQGRFHAYEGHDLESVVFPTRIAAKLGIKEIIITNAAGGINASYTPGELVCITDHINLSGKNPLVGVNYDELGPRFPDMTEAYSHRLIQTLEESAKSVDVKLMSGVYAGVLGPSYETPAEINMLKTLGADLVGMSTVPEVIVANHAGMEVCAISCVTNLAAGISHEKLNHDDVKTVANMAMQKFSTLLTSFIGNIGKQ